MLWRLPTVCVSACWQYGPFGVAKRHVLQSETACTEGRYGPYCNCGLPVAAGQWCVGFVQCAWFQRRLCAVCATFLTDVLPVWPKRCIFACAVSPRVLALCAFVFNVNYAIIIMSTSSNIAIVSYQSPCGKLLLGAFDGRLCLCAWAHELHPGRAQASLERRLGVGACEMASPVTTEAALQLDEYFAGNRVAFTVPLMLVGTEFQQEVWRQLMSVPYGHTVSYGRLAQLLGRSGASRAVANANGANPVSIFVPCHRVVGADGSLTGYAGGIDAKRFLLGVEGRANR